MGNRTGGHTAPRIAGIEGIPPRRLQEWRAYSLGDCRTDRHRVPTDGKRLCGTESSRNGALGEQGSQQRGTKSQDVDIRWDRRVA